MEVLEILLKRLSLFITIIAALILGFILIGNPFHDNSSTYGFVSDEHAEKIPILCYHHVYNGNLKDSVFKGSATVLPLSLFAEHMKYLDDHDFHTATLDELADFMEGTITLPRKTVVLTFDDGYSSVKELIYPILKEYNFQAAVFVIGKYSEEASNDVHRFKNFQYLSFEDMEEISDVFTFENHTFDMHRLDTNKIPLLVSSSPEEVRLDLLQLQNQLDAKYFSYPYGAYDDTTLDLLKEIGFNLAFTVDEGYVEKSTPKYELPRFGMFSYTKVKHLEKIVNLTR